MKYNQAMIGVNKGKEKAENSCWTKISIAGDGKTFILKQFDGSSLDTIALSIEEINDICDFANKEVA